MFGESDSIAKYISVVGRITNGSIPVGHVVYIDIISFCLHILYIYYV